MRERVLDMGWDACSGSHPTRFFVSQPLIHNKQDAEIK